MKYNPALDGLRAVAAFSVVAMHCRTPLQGGAIGVDVFFVLSGYLITTILWSEAQADGKLNLWKFYRNRALRLYPPLLAMLAVWAVVLPALAPGTEVALRVAVVAAYLTDYWIAFSTLGGFLGHTWSLAVEEHFYLIWPFILIGLLRFTPQKAPQLVLLAAALALSWRCLDFAIWHDVRWTVYRFDTNLSGLLFGAFLALSPWRPSSRQADLLGSAALVILAVFLVAYRQGAPLGITLGSAIGNLAAGALILGLTVEETVAFRLLSWPPLVRLGLLSYAIYLWHYPIACILRDQLPPVETFPIVAALSVIFAWLSSRFIEEPIRAWRKGRLTSVPAVV